MYALGNYGDKYTLTRHNIGILVLDSIAKALDLKWKTIEEGEIAVINEGKPELEQIALFKAHTYMNLSGIPLKKLMNRYKIKGLE